MAHIELLDQTVAAAGELGPAIVKSCFGGYDGRGQARISRRGRRTVGRRRGLEEAVDIHRRRSGRGRAGVGAGAELAV